ncbi:MAG TPA: hypothetical protein VJV39_26155, partial [Dongiaceae bacterium]|nr:hypothetical protein [Dongiaceae bacterium]
MHISKGIAERHEAANIDLLWLRENEIHALRLHLFHGCCEVAGPPDNHRLRIVGVIDLRRILGVVEDEPEALVVFELNRGAVMQVVVFLADPEAKDAGVPVDASLEPDDIELNDIDAEHGPIFVGRNHAIKQRFKSGPWSKTKNPTV